MRYATPSYSPSRYLRWCWRHSSPDRYLSRRFFAWPGIGRLAVQGALDNDAPIVAGTALIFGTGYVGLNFIADMLYLLIDPRIRYS